MSFAAARRPWPATMVLFLIRENRVREAEGLDAFSDHLDLSIAMKRAFRAYGWSELVVWGSGLRRFHDLDHESFVGTAGRTVCTLQQLLLEEGGAAKDLYCSRSCGANQTAHEAVKRRCQQEHSRNA